MQLSKIQDVRERQYQRQRDKLKDPEYQARQRAKKQAAEQRRREKLAEKLNSDEYREKQLQKAREQAERRLKKLKEKQAEARSQINSKPRTTLKNKAPIKAKTGTNKPVSSFKKPQKPMKSRGMKGRARTAEEKRLEAKIGALGCICCLNKGWYSSDMSQQEGQLYISMHHVDGRTKPWAHAMQLPLCEYHHQLQPDAALNAPDDLFPLHSSNSSVNEWEAVNGTQQALLEQVYEMIEEGRPWLE